MQLKKGVLATNSPNFQKLSRDEEETLFEHSVWSNNSEEEEKSSDLEQEFQENLELPKGPEFILNLQQD